MTPYTTVTLGDFEFQDFEVPENILFGLAQKQVVHKLIGGKRQIDSLGPDPDDITFTGWLTDGDALSRGLYLKNLCSQGAVLALTWSEMAYTVTIQAARFDFRLAWRIQYTLTMTVVSDDTAPVTSLPSASTEQLLNDDVTQATSLASSIGSSSLTNALGSVTSALSNVGNLATASLAQVKSVLQPITQARSVVTGLMQQASTDLALVGTLASLGGAVPNPVSQFVNGLALGTTGAMQTGVLAQIDTRLGRMAQNIGALNAASKTITTGSTNLFAVAADQYGDAMAWTRVAQANGLTDPAITGITTLSIPAASSTGTGGILNA